MLKRSPQEKKRSVRKQKESFLSEGIPITFPDPPHLNEEQGCAGAKQKRGEKYWGHEKKIQNLSKNRPPRRSGSKAIGEEEHPPEPRTENPRICQRGFAGKTSKKEGETPMAKQTPMTRGKRERIRRRTTGTTRGVFREPEKEKGKFFQ